MRVINIILHLIVFFKINVQLQIVHQRMFENNYEEYESERYYENAFRYKFFR